ncbi:MAG: RNA methyltransferase [Deltaproteobacteria bacterium]
MGLNAALAVAATRPDDIVSIAYTRAVRGSIADLLRKAAARRVPYNEVGDDDLARTADSTHHEGICLLVRPRATLDLAALTTRLTARTSRGALALDRVGNPHNLGAIVRSAAYFGIDAVIFAAEDGHSPLTPAAVRVAEGGAEHVAIAVVPDLASALSALRARGVSVVGADAKATATLSARPPKPPCVVVMGSEHAGLSPAVRAACDRLVAIPGRGALDSLNVSVAAGVLIAELAR